MTRAVSADELMPYLNPEYWNGHTIGYGQPIEPWPSQPPLRPGLSRSKKAIHERLANMEKAIPIETYNDSQVFDVNNYDPGTIVILREEDLRGYPGQLNIDIDNLKQQSLPQRPFDVSPSFGRASTTETISDGEITYFTAATWGIVVASRKDKKALHTVSTGLVDRLDSEKMLVAIPWLLATQTPIEIGETRHYAGTRHAGTKNTVEWLQRINILDVVAYGKTQRKGNRIKSLAAKLSLGHSGL
jgi:hypothetical protein